MKKKINVIIIFEARLLSKSVNTSLYIVLIYVS